MNKSLDSEIYQVTVDDCVLRNPNSLKKIPNCYLGYLKKRLSLGNKIDTLPKDTVIILKQFAFSYKTGPWYWDSEYEAYLVFAQKPGQKNWLYGLMYTRYDDKMQIEWIRNTYSISKKSCSSQVSSGTKIDGPVMPVSTIDAPDANVSSGYYRSNWKNSNGTYKWHGAIDIPVGNQSLTNVPARAMYRVEWIESRPKEITGDGGNQAFMKILTGPYEGKILVYMHLAEQPFFPDKKEFNAGDKIGIVGRTGKGIDNIHLHLEIRPTIDAPKWKDPKTKLIPNEDGRENINKFFRDKVDIWYPLRPVGTILRDKSS